MNKAAIYVLVLAGSAAAGFGISHAIKTEAPQPEIAEPTPLIEQAAGEAANAQTPPTDLPSIYFASMDGDKKSINEWEGQFRLVNFWATWCAPCRREIPLLKSLQQEQSVEGLQVVGIAFDEMDAVVTYHDEIEFNYPVLVGEDAAIALADQYQLELMALPFTLIIGRGGELLNAHVGEIDEQEAAHIIDVLQRLDQQQITLPEAKQQLTL
ncbi:MAG: TlpA disulfide reductase family protein [Pseudomonadota bacterium]